MDSVRTNPVAAAKPKLSLTSGRFSLRTLFFVSFLTAGPFLCAAFVGSDFQTNDAGGAPVFLMLGTITIILAAAIGYSLGDRPGALAATILTGCLWLSTAGLVLLSESDTAPTFPLHAGSALVVTTVVCIWLSRHREPESEANHEQTLEQLLKAKQNSREKISRENDAGKFS